MINRLPGSARKTKAIVAPFGAAGQPKARSASVFGKSLAEHAREREREREREKCESKDRLSN